MLKVIQAKEKKKLCFNEIFCIIQIFLLNVSIRKGKIQNFTFNRTRLKGLNTFYSTKRDINVSFLIFCPMCFNDVLAYFGEI